MKCPHCKYNYGWDNKLNKPILPTNGHFWKSPLKLERDDDWDIEYKNMYACPACGGVFIEV